MAGRSTANAGPSPKYEQRRLEVLRAAARTFNRLGFHIATLDDVAQELGVTKPALYYYAESKDELLSACGQLAIESLERALEESAELELNAVERLSRFFVLYAEIICGDFGRCLALTEPRDLAPRSRKASIAGRRSLNLAVRELIKDGMREGSIRPLNERALSIAMFDTFNGLARWFNRRGASPLTAIVDQHLAVFLDGVTPRQ
jgi:AcrR family transcriptional regulator